MRTIPVHRSKAPLSLRKALALPRERIDSDWYKKKTPHPIQFSLGLDSTTFYFIGEVSAPPYCDESLASGDYREGLWERDVAEFFLLESPDARYQEFNLSPMGAWWSHSFVKYRERDTAHFVKPQGVVTYSDWDAKPLENNSKILTWTVGISIPRRSLSIPISFSESTRINVSFILGAPHERFYSFAPPLECAPDFHRVENFYPVSLE